MTLYRETWEHHDRIARLYERLAFEYAGADDHENAKRCASHAGHAATLRNNIGAMRSEK